MPSPWLRGAAYQDYNQRKLDAKRDAANQEKDRMSSRRDKTVNLAIAIFGAATLLNSFVNWWQSVRLDKLEKASPPAVMKRGYPKPAPIEKPVTDADSHRTNSDESR